MGKYLMLIDLVTCWDVMLKCIEHSQDIAHILSNSPHCLPQGHHAMQEIVAQ